MTSPHPSFPTSCPLCAGPGSVFLPADRAAREVAAMAAVVNRRVHRGGWPVRLMHDEAVDVVGCDRCGTLWRDGDDDDLAERYARERYAPAEMAWLQREGRRALRSDAGWLRANGVRARARVLEVGSYVGSFLHMAQRVGAEVRGIDPNPQLVEFCRRQGLAATATVLDDCALEPGSFDMVAVLNCLDQMPDPDRALERIRRLLRPGGHVVLRTPDARWLRRLYADPTDDGRRRARQELAWGVPFLRCYSLGGVMDLLARNGLAARAVRREADSPWVQLSASPEPAAARRIA